jgi:4-hydroxy-2-oxoheptanedioate aldolase
MVESADDARALVRATRYPPRGIRGMAPDLVRASQWAGRPRYLAEAEGELLLMLQVESRAGLAALDEILAVEGVDGVFIGPADLAADMGLAGQGTYEGPAPEVGEAVLGALRRIADAGRIAGVFAGPEAFARSCRDAGARFLGRGCDVVILAQALRALATRR